MKAVVGAFSVITNLRMELFEAQVMILQLHLWLSNVNYSVLLLHPMTRTLHGFEALLEREWIQAGHPFWSRAASSPDTTNSQGPVFLLFLGRYIQTGGI